MSAYNEKWKRWITYYRQNQHRLATDYLGLNLYPFQLLWIYIMSKYPLVTTIASRGLGKSFIVAVYACIYAILYPGSKVVVTSGSKQQALTFLESKIKNELMNMSPILAKEIRDVSINSQRSVVRFWNGSTITAATPDDRSRGLRAHLLLIDEYRMVKLDILKRVLKPFLQVQRVAPFMSKAKYSGLEYKELNKEVYISSAWFKMHWAFEHYFGYLKEMLFGKKRDRFAFGLDYRTSIKAGLLNRARIEQEKEDSDLDRIGFMMEYGNLFYGQSDKAFYSLTDLMKNRKLKRAFYEDNKFTLRNTNNKKVKLRLDKVKGELRVMGVDVAVMGGEQNDNSVLTFLRGIPNKEYYQREVPYILPVNGLRSDKQALIIKRLFYQFDMDYIALDCQGVGMGIYDELVKVTYDDELDIEYPAWKAFNDEKMAERADKGALPLVFSVKADKKFNHDIASQLRDTLQLGKITLLLEHMDAIDEMTEKNRYATVDEYTKTEMLMPFVQTNLLVSELVNLEWELNGGFIKVFNKRGRKDRYSSLAYGNYLMHHFELKNLRKKKKGKNQLKNALRISKGRGTGVRR